MAYPAALQFIAPAAAVVEHEYGVPAIIVAAQCGIESGWLDRIVGNNAFGVTWRPGDGPRHLTATREWLTAEEAAQWTVEPGQEGRTIGKPTGRTSRNRFGQPTAEYPCTRWFRSYPTLADSFRDHGKLISTDRNYRKVWEQFKADRSIEGLARGIARSGYATSPDYERLLLEVMRMSALVRAIQSALAAVPPKKDSQ